MRQCRLCKRNAPDDQAKRVKGPQVPSLSLQCMMSACLQFEVCTCRLYQI